MSEKPTYCGIVRTKEGEYGPYQMISLSRADRALIEANVNADGWATLFLRKRREPNGDKTHSISIAPPKERQAARTTPAPAARADEQEHDQSTGGNDLPF